MLLGEYEHTIDDKNRLTLPAKFRQAFDEGLVLTRGIERCLYAYPRSEWAATVESRLRELDPLSKEGRLMQRYFFSGASEAEVDKQGRVMVPSPLGRRRRVSSIATLVAIVNTHARRYRPLFNSGYARSARRNVSWNASSAAWPSRRRRCAKTGSLCSS